jgi:hypothetical protein
MGAEFTWPRRPNSNPVTPTLAAMCCRCAKEKVTATAKFCFQKNSWRCSVSISDPNAPVSTVSGDRPQPAYPSQDRVHGYSLRHAFATHTCSNPALTYAPFRSCSTTQTSKPQRAIRRLLVMLGMLPRRQALHQRLSGFTSIVAVSPSPTITSWPSSSRTEDPVSSRAIRYFPGARPCIWN